MKRFIFYILTFAFVSVTLPEQMYSQQKSTEGTDFILSLGDGRNGVSIRRLKFAASDTLQVTLTFNWLSGNNGNGNNRTETFTVNGGTLHTFIIPAGSQQQAAIIAPTAPNAPQNRTVLIHSTKKMSVYAYDGTGSSGDASLILPIDALDTDYYLLSNTPRNTVDSYVVVATKNGTVVQRNGSAAHTLQAFESVRYTFPTSGFDGTGTHITSNNPIAIFATNEEIRFGSNSNTIYQQLLPTTFWGTYHVVPYSANLNGIEIGRPVRVLAKDASTTVTYYAGNATPIIRTLNNAGDFFDIQYVSNISNFVITSDKPVAVWTFAYTYPAMTQVPAVQLSTPSIVIGPFYDATDWETANSGHTAIVIVPTYKRDSTFWGVGTSTPTMLPSIGWNPCAGNGNYSFQAVSLKSYGASSHVFTNKQGVVVLVFGSRSNNAYAYIGGAALRKLTNQFFLNDLGIVNGESYCFDMRIRLSAEILAPLSSGPKPLKWYVYRDGVLWVDTTDVTDWTLPFLSNGFYEIKLIIRDAFEEEHLLEAYFTQFCEHTEAIPDMFSVSNCSPPPYILDVLANDKFGMCSMGTMGMHLSTQPASGGTASFVDQRIVYTPPINFIGRDSMKYYLQCGDSIAYAWAYVTITECPDIFNNPNCFESPPATQWSIRELPINKASMIHNYFPLVTGDIDNDGIVEIIGYRPSTSGQDQPSDGLRIFYVERDTIKFKKDILFSGHTSDNYSSMAMARYNNIGYLVISGTDGYLYAYNAATGGLIWKSADMVASALKLQASVNIIDFNGDGIPEVYTGNRIFSLVSGDLLCDGGTDNMGLYHDPQFPYASMAIDIDRDGLIELCAGTQIYKVIIPQYATTAGSGTMTLMTDWCLSPLALPANAMPDGITIAADIDDDEHLEVVVLSVDATNPNSPSNRVAYVWKPMANNLSYLVGSYEIPNSSGFNIFATPMIGNIDDDPFPEIVFVASPGTIYALHFDNTAVFGDRIYVKWIQSFTDPSGTTGVSLFDFNGDRINEIVYRDETTLRIINGNGTFPTILASYSNVYSGTARELPIIADVDGDGHAEIIIQGHDVPSGTPSKLENGYLRVFKSAGSTWAPTRKVWNQYNYNVVNVNNDLTIPKFQIDPSTFFPGADEILGTSDDIQPFNGFLMQQSLLDKNGNPYMLLPNIVWATPFTAVAAGDSAVFTGCIRNDGSAVIQAPIYVSFYKNDTITTNFLKLDSINLMLMPGDSYCFRFVINDIYSDLSMLSIWISINDKGTGSYPLQKQCDWDGRREFRLPLPGFFVNEYDYSIKGFVICDDEFTGLSLANFVAYPSDLENITWKLNGATIGNTLTINNYPLIEGYYTIEMFVGGRTFSTYFWAGGRPRIWLPDKNSSASDSQKKDWNVAANWAPYGVPEACDDVYIPGVNSHYPVLVSSTFAKCRKIFFMQGGELGHPEHLTYKRAYVQMNLGLVQASPQIKNTNPLALITDTTLVLNGIISHLNYYPNRQKYFASVSNPLERERWYLLSSPLHNLVSGDLCFGGHPLTFMMKFKLDTGATPYNVGRWSERYTALNEPLSDQPTHGYAFYVYGQPTTVDNGSLETGFFTRADLDTMGITNDFHPTRGLGVRYGLMNTNGILELPFFEDEPELSSHRTQIYEQPVSTFWYTNSETGSPDYNTLTGRKDTWVRSSDFREYRFIPDSLYRDTRTWNFRDVLEHELTDVDADVDFLVGNPYMSSIDMVNFLNYPQNQVTLLPEFKIWRGDSKTYISYTLNQAGTDIIYNPLSVDYETTSNPRYIAPMQGFLLKTSSGIAGTGTAAVFDANAISDVRPINGKSNLRSGEEKNERNIINICAKNDYASSYMLIGERDNIGNGFNKGVDVQKLFSPIYYTPEIYALADNTPTDIRFINNNEDEVIIPLGIKIDYQCEIRISFSNMNNFYKAEKIEFIDALFGNIIDLTGMQNYTYNYYHDQTGVCNGRFSLRIYYAATDFPETTKSDNLRIFGNSSGFYVISPSSDPVQKVSVFDFSGRLLFEDNSGAHYYNMGNIITEKTPFIVKVLSKYSTKTEKIQ